MTTLKIGTIQVDSPKAEMIINTTSIDEIKTMFISFLESDFISTKQEEEKGKWAKFAERMSGITDSEITKHIEDTTKEFRDNFKLRNLTTN